jgi:shikimate kinase
MLKLNKDINNIILTGMMGSGKTSIGMSLAYKLGYGFFDIDKEIEKYEKKKIYEIFTEKGEKYFRSIEKDYIKNMSKIKRHVIATGGGTVIDDENWQILDKLGISVFLDTSVNIIARHLLFDKKEIEKRPNIKKTKKLSALIEELSKLKSKRYDDYAKANFIVNCSYMTFDICAFNIIKNLNDYIIKNN